MTPRKLLTVLWDRDAWAPPVFLLGFAALVWTLRALAAPIYRTGEVEEDLGKLAALEKDGRAIVVGASHGKGLELEPAGLTGQNFSHDGQDLFEMTYIARTVRRRVSRVDTVLLALSYFSFGLDNGAYQRGGNHTRIGRRITMYSAFPRPAFLAGDGPEFLKGVFYPVVTRDHFRAGFRALGRALVPEGTAAAAPRAAETEPAPSADAPEAPAGDAAEAGDDAVPDETDAQEGHTAKESRPRRRGIGKTPAWYTQHAHSRCVQYGSLMRNMETYHPELEEDSFRALEKLAADFEADGVSVVLFTPPYYAPYNQCFDRRMQKLMRDNAKRITRATGARYFDFSSSPEFTNEPRLFVDSDHLRPHGKELFSRLLGEAIATKRR
jgi:hypothetical protein